MTKIHPFYLKQDNVNDTKYEKTGQQFNNNWKQIEMRKIGIYQVDKF